MVHIVLAILKIIGIIPLIVLGIAAALVLLLVYGGYFLATAAACRRMARNA